MNYGALLTVVFFVAFIVMVIWVYRPSRKDDYEKHGNMAVENDRRDDDADNDKRGGKDPS